MVIISYSATDATPSDTSMERNDSEARKSP